MKRLLLPLLAALALPTAVNAESYWLVIMKGVNGMEKIEMKDIESCEKEGKRFKGGKASKQYICIIGK